MAMTGGTAKLVKSATPSGFPSSVKLYVYYKEASQSIADNTTTLSLGMYITTPSNYDIGSWTDYNGSYVGTAKSGTNCKTFDGDIPNFSGTRWLVQNQNITVKHDSDGSKTVTIYWKWGVNSSWGGFTNPSGSFSVKLTDIPRAATITSAPNFNDEGNPTIKYSNPAGSSVSALMACISLTGATDDIAYRDISKTGTSYTFNLTDAERKVLRQATKDSNSRTVRFYVRTTIGDTNYNKYVSKTFSIINGAPTLSPTVTDTKTSAIALTGDANNRIIKGYNSIQITSGAAARKEATLESYKITCGGKSLTTASGTMNNVESASFNFSVTDSRGNTTTTTVSKTLVNYVKLTCNLSVNAPTAAGNMSFTIKGNYFNGSFGAVDNALTVQYRYKTNDGEYGAWTTLSPTLSGNTYSVTSSLSGLDYQSTYTFQARALDKIYDGTNEAAKTTKAKKVKTTPIFDWGENDFNFNVNVNSQENVIFKNGGVGVKGKTSDGTELQALQPCNSNNNLALGYGGYTEAIGATNIYGNDINVLTNTDFTVNDGSSVYSLLGAMKAITSAYSLECTTTLGDNYTAGSASALLMGNCLRMYMTCTRSANSGVGDVSNEQVMVIKIKHDGKIDNIYQTGFASSNGGSPATFNASASTKVDDNYLTITVTLCGVAVADNAWSSYWIMPANIRCSAYV